MDHSGPDDDGGLAALAVASRSTPGPAAFGPSAAAPQVGESLGDYRLERVLGRGALGTVFLASQTSLGDRPVVLKVAPLRGAEHLALARLQHPNIVPLYAAHDFPDRGLRALCMPYLGGATLDHVLNDLADYHPADRSVGQILGLLQADPGKAPPSWSGPRQFLTGASYHQAVAWFGVCLAEALGSAHRQGLLHLDLKPSNVLLTADGQPLLLDFHLAQGALPEGARSPARVGGTRGYMAPEQAEALDALRSGGPIPHAVGATADVYGLGAVLFEALAGAPTPGPDVLASHLIRANPRLGTGLAASVARCLASDPARRYPTPGRLADDLRYYLGLKPLHGARPRERLGRWLAPWKRLVALSGS